MKLRQLGEDRLLSVIIPRLQVAKGVVAGAGDDVAVVAGPAANQLLLLKTDCVVEQVHFESGTAAGAIGWKAMMRPLSDFAAVSGLPQFALVTLVISKEKRSSWVEQLYRGLNRAASRFQVSIVGGELSGTRGPAMISVTVSGMVEKNRWTSRRGGKAGDDIFVTGRLGGSRRGKHLRFLPRIAESRWLTDNFPIHAMMDLSDGLGADLPRLARASRVGFRICEKDLPLNRKATVENAISDGEDYELLFAISKRHRRHVQTRWGKKFPKLLLTRIGSLIPRSAIRNSHLKGGYVHFQ